MSGRPPGSIVHLSPWWSGEGPEIGDVLESRTLRRWQLVEVEHRPGRKRPRFRCRVMGEDEPHPPGAVRWLWLWPSK